MSKQKKSSQNKTQHRARPPQEWQRPYGPRHLSLHFHWEASLKRSPSQLITPYSELCNLAHIPPSTDLAPGMSPEQTSTLPLLSLPFQKFFGLSKKRAHYVFLPVIISTLIVLPPRIGPGPSMLSSTIARSLHISSFMWCILCTPQFHEPLKPSTSNLQPSHPLPDFGVSRNGSDSLSP